MRHQQRKSERSKQPVQFVEHRNAGTFGAPMLKKPGNDAVLRKRRREPPAKAGKKCVRLFFSKRKKNADGKKRLLCSAGLTVGTEHPAAYHARSTETAPSAAVMRADFFVEVAVRKEGKSGRQREEFAVLFGKTEEAAGVLDDREDGAARAQ